MTFQLFNCCPLFRFSHFPRPPPIYELFAKQLRQFLAVFTFNFTLKNPQKKKKTLGGKQKVNRAAQNFPCMGKWMENSTELEASRVESTGNSNGNFFAKAQKLQLHCDNSFIVCVWVCVCEYMFIFIFYLVYSWLVLEYCNSRGERQKAMGRAWTGTERGSKSCKLLTHAKSFKQFAQFAMDCRIKS